MRRNGTLQDVPLPENNQLRNGKSSSASSRQSVVVYFPTTANVVFVTYDTSYFQQTL